MAASGYHGAAMKSIKGGRERALKSVFEPTRQALAFASKIPAMYRGAPAFPGMFGSF